MSWYHVLIKILDYLKPILRHPSWFVLSKLLTTLLPVGLPTEVWSANI